MNTITRWADCVCGPVVVLLGLLALGAAGCGGQASGTGGNAIDAQLGDVDVASGLGDAMLDGSVGDTADAVLPDLAAPETAAPADCPGGARCPCTTGNDCDGGICLETMDGHICAAICEGACLPSEICTSYVTPGGDMISLCAPRFVSLCAPCLGNQDCQSTVGAGSPACFDEGDSGKFCSVPCSDKLPCGQGFVCGGTPKHCQPAGGACPCTPWAVAHTSTTLCLNTNAAGTCSAPRTCSAPGPLPVCLAKSATVETCNAVDDNCNGLTDDGADSACDDGNPCTTDACQGGVCQHLPAPVCGDGLCNTVCGESLKTCAVDCHKCNDGVCDPGEGPASCPQDCCGFCGDGKCVGYQCGEDKKDGPSFCPLDCGTACGNGKCDKGENPGNCAADCQVQVCGNHVCEPGDGGPTACPEDCGTACGNCVCDKGEDFATCPNDCGYCGDGTCSLCDSLGEMQTCKADCGDFKLIACSTAWVMFCDDGSPCTDDSCQLGKGCVHLAADGPCSDGNACTISDFCGNGVCNPGSFAPCEDGNPCTSDLCNTLKGCVFIDNDGAACADGNGCTLGDTCLGGACNPGKWLNCDDGNGCTDDKCAGGVCLFSANTSTCDDGSPCTLADACSETVCHGTAKSCDDNNPCTSDACVGPGLCQHTPLITISCRPGITVDTPLRGATFTGGVQVAVQGHVSDPAAPILALTLNDLPVTLDPKTGAFATAVLATPGVNTLVLVATDALGLQKRHVQSFLWSQDYALPLPDQPTTGVLNPGIEHYLGKQTIDDGVHTLPVNDMATAVELAYSNKTVAMAVNFSGSFSYLYLAIGYTVSGSSATYGNATVQLTPKPGVLAVATTIQQVSVPLHVDASGGYGSVDATFTIQSLGLTGSVKATVDAAHKVETALTDVQATVGSVSVQITGGSGLLHTAAALFAPMLVGSSQATIVKSLQDSFQQTANPIFAIQFAKAFNSLAFTADLQLARIDGVSLPIPVTVTNDFNSFTIDADGVTAQLRTRVAGSQKPLFSNLGIPLRPACPGAGAAQALPHTHRQERAVSDDAFNALSYAAWQGGQFEFVAPPSMLGTFDPATFGITDLKLTVSALYAPLLSDCLDGKPVIAFADLKVLASMQIGGVPLQAVMFLTFRGDVEFTTPQAGLSLQLAALQSSDLQLDLLTDAPIGVETLLETLMKSYLLPNLLSSLGQQALGKFPMPLMDLSSALGHPPGTDEIGFAVDAVLRTPGRTAVVGGTP